jgi:hypothetical protein
MRRNSSPTDRSDNFTRRLKETIGSELEPELVTPNTAAEEEMPDRAEVIPLLNQFKQTNGRGRNSRSRGGQNGPDNQG